MSEQAEIVPSGPKREKVTLPKKIIGKNGEIIVRRSSWKVWLMLIVSLTFTIFSYYFFTQSIQMKPGEVLTFESGESYSKWECIVISFLCLIGCLGSFIIDIIILFRKRPALVIDENGITGFVNIGYIAWEDIESFNMGGVHAAPLKLIEVKVYDLEKLIRQDSDGNIDQNVSHGYPPVTIMIPACHLSTGQLFKILNNKLYDYRSSKKEEPTEKEHI